MRPPVANIDSLIIVASTVKPRPSTLVIDKLTAVAEHKNIEPVIIVTKDDLAPADELVSIYKHAGFVSVAVSNETGEGVGEVRKLLCGKQALLQEIRESENFSFKQDCSRTEACHLRDKREARQRPTHHA